MVDYSIKTEENGRILTVECPECSRDTTVSLPRSAEIVAVTRSEECSSHNIDTNELDRPREHQWRCPKLHTVSVLYDW